MRFRKKKGDEEEVVSGEVVSSGEDPSTWALPADALQDDTVDMDAVAPATAAGAEADRRAEEARLADEQAAQAEASRKEAEKAEKEAKDAEEKARREAEAAEKAQREAEEAAEAQRKAGEKAREEAPAAAAPTSTVSGASVMSPGLGSDASPRAAAAANKDSSAATGTAPGLSQRADPAPEPLQPAGSGASAGPLAPVLEHPSVQKKPELLVVGGLAAGFVVAKILKALGSDD